MVDLGAIARFKKLVVAREWIDPLPLFRAGLSHPLFYFRYRDERRAVLMLGASPAAEVSITELDSYLNRWSEYGRDSKFAWPPLMVGSSFAPESSSIGDEWGPFGAMRVSYPQAALISDDDLSVIVYHDSFGLSETKRLSEAWLEVKPPADLPVESAEHTISTGLSFDDFRRSGALSGVNWGDGEVFESGILACQAEELKKVVISHRISTDHPADLSVVRRRDAAGSYLIFWQETPSSWLLSRTPERLLSLTPFEDSWRITTEAVGGTLENNSLSALTPGEDEKLREEHELIVQGIYEELGSLWRPHTSVPNFEQLRLRTLTHLRTILSGVGPSERGVSQLLKALHPTAAVAGYPKAEALQVISRLEPHKRGWYTGYVGVAYGGSLELAVILRSLLGSLNSQGTPIVYAHAGCGILADSDKHREALELNLKFQSFIY